VGINGVNNGPYIRKYGSGGWYGVKAYNFKGVVDITFNVRVLGSKLQCMYLLCFDTLQMSPFPNTFEYIELGLC